MPSVAVFLENYQTVLTIKVLILKHSFAITFKPGSDLNYWKDKRKRSYLSLTPMFRTPLWVCHMFGLISYGSVTFTLD